MRVLLDVSAVPAQPVGAGIYTVELARELDALGEVELVLLTRRNDAYRWSATCPRSTIHSVVPDNRPARLLWEATRAAKFAETVNCDVWHGPHYTLPTTPPCASVVTVHDLTFFDQPETHQRVKVAFFRSAIRRNAARASAVVCVSHATAQRLHELIPTHAPITVAHHGVDHERFRVDDAAPTVAADLAQLAAIGARAPFIAFVGTLQPRKGLPGLVAAFAAARAEHPDLQLVLAGGDGWGRDELSNAITVAGVATSVLRPGYVNDETVAALYRRAAVVAYPSLAEGFGLPALEAMACGAPLVTTKGTAMDEFIGDAAITAGAGDVSGLARALLTALDPKTAAGLRHRGPTIAAEYTWSACARTHVEAYRQALASFHPSH